MPWRNLDATGRFAQAYAAALREYVTSGGEEALTRAYELGRSAAGAGLGILDVAMLHHGALAALAVENADARPSFESAAQFLAESLSPFEMTLRSYQANARLLGLSEALAEQNAEIDRAREQLRTILDATTAVIYLKDAEGRYLFVNRQFQDVFELRREEVLGRTDQEVLPPPVARTLQSGDAGVLDVRAPQQVEETFPSAGGARTYLSVKFPLIDADGRPYGICCVATDITERKRAEEALLREREAALREAQLHRELEARDQFITVASHELKTPVTCLELQVQLLRRLARSDPTSPVAGEKVQARCDAILGHLERLTALMNTILEVGKMTSGRLELSLERLDLGDVVRRVLAASEDAIRRSRSEVVLGVDGPVVGTWDRASLESALAQVVLNALKFSEGKPVHVEVGGSGDRAFVKVRDQGFGIAAQDHERIFERFERGVSERHFGGLGVGLWISRKAIEAHGGSIAVKSSPGDGAEFTIELPLARGGAPDAG